MIGAVIGAIFAVCLDMYLNRGLYVKGTFPAKVLFIMTFGLIGILVEMGIRS